MINPNQTASTRLIHTVPLAVLPWLHPHSTSHYELYLTPYSTLLPAPVHVQIGQVMLTTPNAWYKMGLIPGTVMIIWGTLLGICEWYTCCSANNSGGTIKPAAAHMMGRSIRALTPCTVKCTCVNYQLSKLCPLRLTYSVLTFFVQLFRALSACVAPRSGSIGLAIPCQLPPPGQ